MKPELIVGSIAAWTAQALERSACSPCRGKPVRVMTSAELAFETSRAILDILPNRIPICAHHHERDRRQSLVPNSFGTFRID